MRLDEINLVFFLLLGNLISHSTDRKCLSDFHLDVLMILRLFT
jgi:hypothetical protein